MVIIFWPDGTWCHKEELDEYQWKSDDFEMLEIAEMSDKEIDEMIVLKCMYN